ncbi:MAG TPA: hypothetical protein VHE12_03570 [bacterium]|nr:hypothetical protein [bacterium]
MEPLTGRDWTAPIQQFWSDIQGFAPNLLAALMVLAAGFVLAWMARWLVEALFRALRLEKRLQDLWFFRLWSQGFQGRKATQALSAFSFYLVLFLAVLLAIHMLGGGGGVLNTLLGVVPRVLSFMMILFLGSLLAMFISVLAQLALLGSGAQHPRFWGKVVAWSTFAVTVMFSLEPLGLVGSFLTTVVLIVLGAVGLGGAIAFGLGAKDLAREFLIEMLKNHDPE